MSRRHTEETKEKLRKKAQERWEDPELRERERVRATEQWKDPELLISEHLRQKDVYINHPERWDHLSEFMVNYHKEHPELGVARSEAMILKFSNPVERKRESERQKEYLKSHPEKAQKHSESMKKLWRDPITRAKILNGRGRSPNILERLFDSLTSDSVRFVGNGSFWRTLPNGKHKNPDFKVKGQRKVIELFGDYWHRYEDPLVLIEMFHRIDYECLVIWESEIRDDLANILTLVDTFIEI